MKFIRFLFLIILSIPTFSFAQTNWKYVEGKIVTPWADDVSIDKPLNDYPRPQLTRKEWTNLNGLWNYKIQPGKFEGMPNSFDGQILVPFPIESALSGVGKNVGENNTLWYQQIINLEKPKGNNQIILHFGAVDWSCEVYINNVKVGTHEGGFNPFSFNITRFLKSGKKQDVRVAVWDPTNKGPQPIGKQRHVPAGIFYTPVTGIWQTVWAEEVSETHIVRTKNTVDFDNKLLAVDFEIQGFKENDKVLVSVWNGKVKIVEKSSSNIQQSIQLKVDNPIVWSPSNPFLYDLKYQILRNGKVLDEATSYFAMRKISMGTDENGIQRPLLNNEFLFQYGLLDQGWWPDGLYTAPTDKALLFDIEKTKEMGFNMIRKHIKVEPARWYYHCDRLGLLVWQDMPSGDWGGNTWDKAPSLTRGLPHEKVRTAQSEAIFRKEWRNIIDALYNFPSIIMWTPFNEAWGQFKTVEITNWTLDYDPSRLVNSASGGNFYWKGHVLDIHNYPNVIMPKPDIFGKDYILALGEFGGLGLALPGHTWQDEKNWGYQNLKNKEELKEKYKVFVDDLKRLIPQGLSAAVYTQTTDVEIETNGLMTYDRKVIKIPEKALYEMHKNLYK